MTPALSTDKMRYYQLLGLVCEDLHTSAIDALVRKGHKATTAQLKAIRQGPVVQARPSLAKRRSSIGYLAPKYLCPQMVGSNRRRKLLLPP